MILFIKREILKPILLFSVHRPKLWSGIRGLISALPIVALGYLSYNFDGQGAPEQTALANYFNSTFSIVALIASPFLVSVICDVYEWIGTWLCERQADHVPAVTLTKILASLNNVVGSKQDRFGAVAKNLNVNPISSKEVFSKITKPELQIEELVEQVWTLLTSVTENANLKVVLVELENEKPIGYAGYSPKSRRPTDDLLNPSESFFAYVAKKRSFQVIDDIASYINKRNNIKKKRERNKHFPIHFAEIAGADNIGSICGFPIFHSHLNNVVYVMTIKTDSVKGITGHCKRAYLPMLEHFFDRILLEHSLKIIKKNAN